MVRSTFFNVRRCLVAVVAGLLAIGGAAIFGISPAAAVAGLSTFAISPSPAAAMFVGVNAQAASNETFTLPNTWATGNTITFTIASPGLTNNCPAGTNYVSFATTPTVTVVAAPTNGPPADPAPIVVAALSANGADGSCSTVINDVLTLTLPAPVGGSMTSDTFTVTLSGISYDVGAAAPTGLIHMAVATTMAGGTTGAVSNAVVEVKANASASGNNPASYVTGGTTGVASNIVISEAAFGATSTTICVTPIAGITSFSFNGTPSTAALPTGAGAGTVTSTVLAGASILVTVTPSTSVATTYTISGVSVADSAATGPAYASVTTGGANCGADTAVITTPVPVFDSIPVVNANIAGGDPDGTAIAELEAAFPIGGGTGCVPSHRVILATDQGYPDALSASYLAGYLNTGILLTPTTNLSSETMAALQAEGITNVDIVGGTLAVSQNTINQVEGTPAYTCGGPGVGALTGSNITVTGPIFGQTQYDTSEFIATTPPATNVASIDLAGAYNNAYNDTGSGAGSSAPEAAGVLKTAVVAQGLGFQDASAASVMAYHNQFPLLLTDPSNLSPQASAGLTALGIKQVIVLGGIDAISAGDVTSIQALGISVIRIAGLDATDTAQELANFELNQAGSVFLGLGWGAVGIWAHTILVAQGAFYSDALAGCVLAAVHPTPLLLTEDPTTIGSYLPVFLNAGGSAAGIDGLNTVGGSSGNIQTVQPLGGTLALTVPTLTALAQTVGVG
jgi:putative cell wall-binding protein